MVMMGTIFCLAHYCETHGPTPLMATEALPVECSSCIDEAQYFNTRRTSVASRMENLLIDDYPTPKASNRTNSSSSSADFDKGSYTNSYNSSPAIVDTPPESPRLQTTPFPLIRDSSFRKTYTDADKARASPCENCALTLPPKTSEQSTKSKLENNGPILRTRKVFERIRNPSHLRSPPQSTSSSSASESEETEDSESERGSRPQTAIADEPHVSQHLRRVGTGSTSSSTSSRNHMSHEHFLDYTSSHEPLVPASFSVVRQSCLRTLSMETLPPTTAPSSATPFLTLATSTSSGGPIFFGDNQAGWTIAFKFRIPDPTARGRRRQYAFIMHSTLSQRLAMSFFTKIGTKFQEMANWIQSLADAQLEKTESYIQSPRLGAIDESRSQSDSAFSDASEPRRGSDGTTSSSTSSMKSSAFLSGRTRGSFNSSYTGGMGMGGAGAGTKGKGLAELVGKPDIFFELHCQFVRLLMTIGSPGSA